MKTFERGDIYFFECDERGKSTRYDGYGYKNSSGGNERPFLILTNSAWNKSKKNEDMFAVPLTRSGKGNTFSISISDESLNNPDEFHKFRERSVILCDKVCRVSEPDLHNKDRLCSLTSNCCNHVRNLVLDFIRANM